MKTLANDQFFIKGSPGEQFGLITLCEDEIDRLMDKTTL